MPAGVPLVRNDTFVYCRSLRSVTISDGVTGIGERAFKSCKSLTNIAIPGSVASIGEDVLADCSKLETISVAPGNSTYRDIDGVLFTKDQSTLILFPRSKSRSYTIPSGTVRIGKQAFWKCQDLTSIVISDGVVDIGEEAFCRCTSLTGVTIPASVTNIEKQAFLDCWKLKSATFEGNAPVLGKAVFDDANRDFIIYYSSGASGFTHPLWHGYPTSVIGTD
jgi:hypothetical protein